MKRLLLAALLALPALAVGQSTARADGLCFGIPAGFHVSSTSRINVSLHISRSCGGGCGFGGCGFGCSGAAPGPWYQYWPNQNGVMAAPSTYPGWRYDNNFQTPAPVYPFWGNAASQGGSYQPVGYYPSYWYGR